MRPIIGWPIAIILALLTVGAYLNGDAINEWIRENSVVVQEEEAGPLVGIVENEKWLVVLVDFPDVNEPEYCNQQHASNLIDDAAEVFMNQGVGPDSTLEIVYHDRIISADHKLADYGHDTNGAKDVGKNDVNPRILAMEIVLKIKDEVDWAKFDLNDDGWVDRFLILHCEETQEDNKKASSINSHFSSIEEIVELPDGLKISHYAISSQYSSRYLGTIIHEVYHQLGAADLYPVEDDTVNQDWSGIGDWDIMGTGNWNGNGVWPALPTGPSIELMGGNRHQEIELEWLSGTDCQGPQYVFTGISEEGTALKIPIDDEEYIWIEYRSDSGYDSDLPGHGLLVLQHDLKSGDVEDNIVNSHPERAWLTVIEADGQNDMQQSSDNEGESSDLFWDGGIFGADGITIRNRDGILVDWIANVSLEDGKPMVKFSSANCGHSIDIDLPDYGSVLTPNDSIPIKGYCEGIDYDLYSSDGRNIEVQDEKIIFSDTGIVGVVGVITGTITCDSGTDIDIRHEFEILGNIPIEYSYSGIIDPYEKSSLAIPIEFVGEGSQLWLVGVDGPLSRVATTENVQKLSQGSDIILDIEPGELLSDGMVVKGEIIIASDSGHRYIIYVELVAETSEESRFDEWTTPDKLVPIALALATLWVILGIRSFSGEVPSEEQEVPTVPHEGYDPSLIDPFS